MMRKLITKRQHEVGWKEFRRDTIPNVRTHQYVVERIDENGHYVVLCHFDGSPMDGGVRE